MEPNTRWHRAADRARDQFGVISHGQLLDCGFSSSALGRAAATGHLVPIHRGVYGVGQRPTDYRAPLMAAILLAGPDSRVACYSAGALLGISPNSPSRVWVASPHRRRASRPGVEIRSPALTDGEVGVFRGVPCTSPSRTILDLTAIEARLGEAAVERAGNEGLLDVDDLLALIERNPGRRGIARVRRILLGHERVPVFTRSELERRLYRLCRRDGTDLPDMNVQVYAGSRLFECDAVWPQFRLIVECDSRWHDNPVTARSDAERDELLTLAGWRVFRMRWAQIALRPARASATIKHLIASQRRLLRASADGAVALPEEEHSLR